MKIAHVALWTRDLDEAARFWQRFFDARIGPAYHSKRRPGFASRFLTLAETDVQIELMSAPWLKSCGDGEFLGWSHIALSLGSKAAVDVLAQRCAAHGLLEAAPRTTGDGFYEAVITGPDGCLIEITV